MKKYVLVSAMILGIAISFIFYIYRVQDLGDVVNIDQVDRIFLTTVESERENEGIEIKIPKISEDQKNKLADFLNQYKVRLTMKEGWSSENPSEQFTLRIVYKNGEFEIFIFDHDVVASTRIYEVVNAPLDFKWIKEFECELHSND
ncbi:hypothetical protein J7I80_06710 [Bacillus sp. ISL-41]|uniref:hypothetical protein n=1 Tax=Bacillus sp. ISL-41 TaxID=2819127 RepID=UPI001BE79EBD|nr:hypothetical protein [Bacillus sp. ISL-41]MBT2641909.1 hypothetical protein [Bacillus sp. ISL-41]